MWNQLLRLSAGSTLGLQEQIRRTLVAAILDGHLPAGTPVPSSRWLADSLDVARNTVVLAYQQLVDSGYLVSRERSGHYVNPDILGFKPEAARWQSGNTEPSPAWSRRFRVQPSKQRNIVKRPDWQQFAYPFVYGQFDASLFPTHEWRQCCMRELSAMQIRDWAPDLISRDDARLVREIQSKVLPRRGVWAAEDEILITVGAQHALFLLADILVGPRTVVGVENPGYPDARNIFGIRTQHIEPLALDGAGTVLDDRLRHCDYVYVTPSHQCPTTVTMDLPRRKELLRMSEDGDFVLVEDDYESESSFSCPPNPALKSLDRNNRVIYVGSLSKAFAPGLRLGYIVGPRELIREVRALRRLMLRHPTAFVQRSFATFLALGHFDTLQRRLATAHRERAQALEAALARHLPGCAHVPILGGASCWLHGPAWLDSLELAYAAAERSILIEPGDIFFASDTPPLNYFRLGFSSIAAERIEAGVRELALVIEKLAPK